MNTMLNALDTASVTVSQAARHLAAALAETAEFQAFEQASAQLRADPTTGQVIQAFQAKQQALQALLTLGAASAEEQAELAQLERAVREHPAVTAYTRAQAGLVTLCQTVGDALSEKTGLNFASVCGSGCC